MSLTHPWRCFLFQRNPFDPNRRLLRTMVRHKDPRRPPAQKKPPLTHFLCVPLVTSISKPQLEASLMQFREDVSPKDPLVNEQDVGLPVVHPKAIRPVGAIHCTLGVMSLDQNKLSEAIEFLRGVDIHSLLQDLIDRPAVLSENTSHQGSSGDSSSSKRPISIPEVGSSQAAGPLTIDLKGLVSMHAPQSTSILYSAPTDVTGRLYPFCVALQKLFQNKGFLVEDNRQLKLHATIVNTIYAKGRRMLPNRFAKQQAAGPSGELTASAEQNSAGSRDDRSQGHGPNANAPLKIDTTAILENYKDFAWAENVVLDRVAICEMGAKKIIDAEGNVTGEEYTEVASIALPT